MSPTHFHPSVRPFIVQHPSIIYPFTQHPFIHLTSIHPSIHLTFICHSNFHPSIHPTSIHPFNFYPSNPLPSIQNPLIHPTIHPSSVQHPLHTYTSNHLLIDSFIQFHASIHSSNIHPIIYSSIHPFHICPSSHPPTQPPFILSERQISVPSRWAPKPVRKVQ